MPFQPLEPADPQSVGPYRLLARLGAGGMGRVYLARSAGGRTVAVKVVRAELAEDPEFRERFRREVAAARLVSGPHTAPVVDADQDGPAPWLATTYVLGPSLTEAVAGHGPLPLDSVRALGLGLARALDAIHRAGLIHRDLKPSNVLLAADGPRVIDFGIARALEGDGLTSTGVVVGSPGFMCPEQAGGGVLGPAGDVFSLGSVLAFAATGVSPFSGETGGTDSAAALLYRVIHDDPSLDALPEELLPVVAACLAKDPADRPTPAELAELLDLGATALGPGWLPRALAAELATHAAAVLDLDVPVAPAAPADPRPAVPHPHTRVSEPAPTGTVRLLAGAPTQPGAVPADSTRPGTAAPAARPSRRLFLAGGTAALLAAAGGAAWAFGDSGHPPTPRPAPEPTPTAAPATGPSTASPSASPSTTRRPGVAPTPLWTHPLPDTLNGATPLVAGDAVYLYGIGGAAALEAASGQVRWQLPADPETAAAVSGGALVYNGDNLVKANPLNGNPLWTYAPRTTGSMQLQPDTVLAADDQAVYALCRFQPLDAGGDPDPSAKSVPGVFALSAADGSVLWSQQRKPDADTDVLAMLTPDLLLYTDSLTNLVARSRKTGEQVWFAATDALAPQQPVADADRVYCSSAGHGLQAVDLATQKQSWVKPPPAGSKDLWYAPPTVVDGVVYVVLGGMTLQQYNATPSAPPALIAYQAANGQELWRCALPYECSMNTAPVVVQQTCFVSTDNNGIYAVDTTAHTIRWTFQPGLPGGTAWLFSTDGKTLVASQDTKVYALPPV
ncbi:serine/threonine-protein kinase [Kitasatospora sp. NBC_01287]|uniref:serine/threonine-protein kinase n=1 Tax=Kitasatospora sp. NBC_01287 TaxID=2903573 RepID=UPI00224D4006|nr:serine/threonine-protein kinase [Kitasatospora sp. NBC_01287]MCX4749314.1 serine/threonine-protein kinase [Kitasatospora sp. NBC_01287]